MSSNPYQQFFEAQKNMFDDWQNSMKTAIKDFNAQQGVDFNPDDFYTKMYEGSQQFWEKVGEGSKSYHAIYELWKSLSEKNTALDSKASLDIYNVWRKQHFSLIKDTMIPHLPEYMKNFAGKYVESMESSSEVMSDYLKNWAENDDALKHAFYDALGDGPKGYVEYLETWQKSYEKTFGKMLSAPTFGRDMEFWQSQKSSFDRFIRYSIAATKFYTSLADIAQDATEQVIKDYAEMHAQGTQPKTFDEFYKYWSRTVSKNYEKVLFSDEISVLAGNMVNEMAKFKMEHDKLCEFYLAYLPVPKKSDMDNLYKTVHEMKKELRTLKRAMAAQEKAPNQQ